MYPFFMRKKAALWAAFFCVLSLLNSFQDLFHLGGIDIFHHTVVVVWSYYFMGNR